MKVVLGNLIHEKKLAEIIVAFTHPASVGAFSRTRPRMKAGLAVSRCIRGCVRRNVMLAGSRGHGFVRGDSHRVEFSVGPGISSPRRSIRPPAMGLSHSRSRPEEVGFAHA